jgi:hypothetical protein
MSHQNNKRREQKQRPRESIILENFLRLRNPQGDGNSQEMDNPQAYAQELNPD